MLNAAIVGLGRWGQNLVNHIQGKSDKIRVTLGVLRHPENARAYAHAKGFPLVDSLDKALADPGIDAIILATPHTAHAEQIIACAKAGKPVFTEKPFTLTTESAKAALRACAQAKVTLGVGYNWRYQPALLEIRRMIEDGTLGRVLHIEGNFCGPSAYRFPKGHWRHDTQEVPAGGMTGRGVHVIDAMLSLAGPIEQVSAQSFRLAQDFRADDTTSMLLRFARGATGYLGTVIASAETWRMQVFGSNGWAQVGDVEHLTTWDLSTCMIDREHITLKQRPIVRSFPKTSTERAELEHFAKQAAARQPLALPGGDAVHNVAVLQAIVDSIATQQPVRVA